MAVKFENLRKVKSFLLDQWEEEAGEKRDRIYASPKREMKRSYIISKAKHEKKSGFHVLSKATLKS